jgi:hypothetical protein
MVPVQSLKIQGIDFTLRESNAYIGTAMGASIDTSCECSAMIDRKLAGYDFRHRTDEN